MAHHCCGGTFWLYIAIITGLVAFAGIMSGLTLGLMSLSLVDLEVLQKSGTERDKKHAAKILPVVRRQHLLLCTLLIGNACAMEALPIFLDSLVPSWASILLSVTLILIFSEIIPQAVCSRYGLAIGAAMAPFVRLLVWFFLPAAYPISKLLDYLLGEKHAALYRRAELQAFVNMHGQTAGKGGELTTDETSIIAGALELTTKTAAQAMTPLSEVFALDVDVKLDWDAVNQIMLRGHSRVPVYSRNISNIIGVVLVKNLMTIRPEDAVPVRNVLIRKIPRVDADMPLYDILNEFQKGHSHMAVVVEKPGRRAEGGADGAGPHTVVDVPPPGADGQAPKGQDKSSADLSPGSLAASSPLEEEAPPLTPASNGHAAPPKAERPRQPEPAPQPQPGRQGWAPSGQPLPMRAPAGGPGGPPTAPGSAAPVQRPKLLSSRSIPNMQARGVLLRGPSGGPGGGSPLPGRDPGGVRSGGAGGGDRISQRAGGSRRWLHSGHDEVLDVSGGGAALGAGADGAPLHSLAREGEEVVGIITMEDVIEELLQEEILDESDEYFVRHNLIRIGAASGSPAGSAPPAPAGPSTEGHDEHANLKELQAEGP